MPILKDKEPIEPRENDVHFAESMPLLKMVEDCGVKNAEIQRFCIDENIFKVDENIEREEKIIFIGSSYHLHTKKLTDDELFLMDKLREDYENGIIISGQRALDLAKKYNVDPGDVAVYPVSYILRDASVRALCEQNKIKLEIYGYEWDYDPIFKDFYKGPLSHGEDVAKAYNSAKYALVCLPGQIQTQRLTEAAACGCIPLVYDARKTAAKPHWDDHCLFYSGAKDLREFNYSSPPKNPLEICAGYTYKDFAQRLIDVTKEKQANKKAMSG